MFTFLVVVTVLLFVALILVAGMIPNKHALQADVISTQRIATAFLLVSTILLLVVAFDWLLGITIGLFVVLFYGTLSKTTWVAGQSAKLSKRIEPAVRRAIKKYPKVWRVFRVITPSALQYHVETRHEFTELIKDTHVLTTQEKSTVLHALAFNTVVVGDVMTPKKQIATIQDDEFLGPLVLDELHGLGHSRLPVIHTDVNKIIGIVSLEDLLSLDSKNSVTAAEAMHRTVLKVKETDALSAVLPKILQTRHHMAIVVDDEKQTVGLITVNDILGALLGYPVTQ